MKNAKNVTKTKAAILFETGKPLVITEINIPELKPGQVLIEIEYSGVCHTQILEARGYRGEDRFLPHCLGHEGSGTVKEISECVTKVKVGDKVILSWMKSSGKDIPGSIYTCNGKNINAGAITTFSQYAVISENRIIPLKHTISLKDAAMVGCAVATGLGSVFNVAKPKPGESLAVFGTGGIGLCAIKGADIAGCTPIIAVDINDERLKIAKKMGATHTINPDKTDVLAEINKICGQSGLDFAIESSGVPNVMLTAIQSVRNQGGTAVIIGNAKQGETLNLDPKQLNMGKRILGTWGGDNNPEKDFPRYLKLIETGKLNLENLTSKIYSLEMINEALLDLETGRITRPLIKMK